MTKAYILSGLPGAGKSKSSTILSSLTGGKTIEAGSVIREMARTEEGLTDPTSEELGDFAARKREELGDGFFADSVIELMEDGVYNGAHPYIIDSVRHIDGYETLAEYFMDTELIWVAAWRENRLERVQDRGRDDEADFTYDDILARDKHELENLGTITLVSDGPFDHVVHNNGSVADLREELEEIVPRP